MDKEKQRIAIAEARGWKRCDKCGTTLTGDAIWHLKGHGFSLQSQLPNYPEDLNAMREALLTLTPAQQCEFGERLAGMLGHADDYYDGWNISASSFFEAATAKAEMLSECFIKTIGKWEDA